MQSLDSVPDERIVGSLPAIRERWEEITENRCIAGLRGEGFLDAADDALFVEFLRLLGAHEGALWLVEEVSESLAPVHVWGEGRASRGNPAKQPLSNGLLGMVIATQSGVCESWVGREDSTADDETGLGESALHFAAVPFFLCGEARGVISAVKHAAAVPGDEGDPDPFREDTVSRLLLLSHTLGETIGARSLRRALGL